MNKSKTLIVAAMLALTVVPFTGCSTIGGTPQTEEQKLAQIGTICELAAYTGATIELRNKPETRGAFIRATSALGLLISGSDATPEQLSQILNDLPIKELKGSNGDIIISAAIIVYDGYIKQHVTLDNTPYVKAAATGIHSGLSRALVTP